jgi:hypothetical protein
MLQLHEFSNLFPVGLLLLVEKSNIPIGPITGPIKGPIAQAAIAAPLFSCGKISAIDPAPIVSGQLPANPAKNRNTTRLPISGATAQAIVQIT